MEQYVEIVIDSERRRVLVSCRVLCFLSSDEEN